jgi:acetyl-CoA carboxylase biotin carboxyl carrier protein
MAKKKTGNDSPRASASRADLAEVARILEFMTQHGLEELEYRRGDLHVRLKRQAPAGPVHASPTQVPVVPASSAAHAGPAAPIPAPYPSVSPQSGPADNFHTVKSPIVGTFYAAPSPGAPPFVKLGDVVKRGQVLCIVEAMKLMNEIEADQAGEIVRQFTENGQPVEYGQPLFALRPMAES